MTLQAQQNPSLADIANAVSITADNGVVGVNLSYPVDAMCEFMKANKVFRH